MAAVEAAAVEAAAGSISRPIVHFETIPTEA